MDVQESRKSGYGLQVSSTSKVSVSLVPVAAIAASDANLEDIRKQMRIQTIGHDKLNQLTSCKIFLKYSRNGSAYEETCRYPSSKIQHCLKDTG